MTGNKPLNFDGNDIIINDIRYNGTPRLWRLLTHETAPDPVLYTNNEWL